MTNRRIEIQKDKYIALMTMDKVNAQNEMLEIAPSDWRFGYGIYDARPVEIGGRFFVEFTTGDICD